MEKSSKIDLDRAMKLLAENELGILLLEADAKSMYDILAEKSTYEDRQGMYGEINGTTCHITYHLYPLYYKKVPIPAQNLINSRVNAIQNVFCRWTAKGYNKHHAKSPYGCKAFNEYLDEIGYNNADYMLLLVE